MSNSQVTTSRTARIAETGATTFGVTVGVTAALHELDANYWISAPWAQEVPVAEHSSSMIGSFTLVALTVAAAERVAAHMERRGRERAAEITRRAGRLVAVAGSVACQLAIETSARGGVSDGWDFTAGVAATVPGIIAGQIWARDLPGWRQHATIGEPSPQTPTPLKDVPKIQ